RGITGGGSQFVSPGAVGVFAQDAGSEIVGDGRRPRIFSTRPKSCVPPSYPLERKHIVRVQLVLKRITERSVWHDWQRVLRSLVSNVVYGRHAGSSGETEQ